MNYITEQTKSKFKGDKNKKMADKSKRNELLITYTEINRLIEELESKIRYEKATDLLNQLLYAYDLKIRILEEI